MVINSWGLILVWYFVVRWNSCYILGVSFGVTKGLEQCVECIGCYTIMCATELQAILYMVSTLPPPHCRASSKTHWVMSRYVDNGMEFLGRGGAGSPALICNIIFYLLHMCSSCILGRNTRKAWHLWRKGCANGMCLNCHAFLCINLGPSTINQVLDVCS